MKMNRRMKKLTIIMLLVAMLLPARTEINTADVATDPWRVSLPLKSVRGISFRITGAQQGR